ncbi:DUF2252 domain-containing protein [Duganella sp. FT80W]|uniref:DUF2252 domain-containing protein n=1 Tax=Duganella guangzhouensis TaxID=2666084 RepID=A0A6I2L1B1_9BURK|nr:DUF2252 family protein [Duganella guangzhouensis]MRW91632.1 DUF2252 domain-containing protein [Duganella guangzhouensis]
MANLRERDVVGLVAAFNAGRDPERVTMKYRLLADNPFSFLRGSCHLFYQDFPADAEFNQAPPAWVCGDLHLENFGSYKGDNRLAYFDLNDFDEAVLAPASWELSRFLVSVLVAADTLKVGPEQAIGLCHCFLDAYAANLIEGKARWVERATADGMVRDLLRDLRLRERPAFLDRRTDIKKGKRRLRLDGVKALPVSHAERDKVVQFMTAYADTQPTPAFFRVLDVARRIAGTGSLGLERYAVLVRGRGGLDGNFLLDLKIATGSALAPYVPLAQPQWHNEAERVVAVQQRMQAIAPAFLSAVSIGSQSYVLKELLPQQDRLSLNQWGGKLRRLESVMRTMGAIVAWSHLRSGGRQGSATADQWIAYGRHAAQWRAGLLDYARAYHAQVVADWRQYAADYRAALKGRAASF